MDIIYYDKASRILITEKPSFPNEDELKAAQDDRPDFITIQEWQTYYIKFYGQDIPAIFEAAPFITKSFKSLGVYEINYRNYVGLTQIGKINLKVENRKISDVLFDSMLEYITGKYENLVFSFNKATTGFEYKKGKAGKDIAFIEYLFLKAYLIDRINRSPTIDEISGLILSEPHKKLFSEKIKCQIDETNDIDVSLIIDLFSNPERMELLPSTHVLAATALGQSIYKATGKNYYPTEAKRTRKYYTFDTNENRFILHFLKNILRTLDSLEQALGYNSGTYLNPTISSNIKTMKQKINYLLADPLWNEVGKMNFIPSQSTVLHRKDGYRHLFHLYSLMQLLTRYQFLMEDFKNIIENKDVATLYEYWCFFQVKDILDKKYKTIRSAPIVPPHNEELKVQEGIRIEYENDIALIFNLSATGSLGVAMDQNSLNNYQTHLSYSHTLRPDIVLIKNGKAKLILDAKYKGRTGSDGFYGENFGEIVSFKEEDLDKMHTYREAIKDVTGAFALYPGNKAIFYPSHRAKMFYEGIGALPLRPAAGGIPEHQHIGNIETLINDFTNQLSDSK